MNRYLGLDIAVTADCRACLTDETGQVLSESRFRIAREDLERLHQVATKGLASADRLVVVMEPTASSWIAPAAFFQAMGAVVHLVKPEQSADLRSYYAKHVKNGLALIPLEEVVERQNRCEAAGSHPHSSS